MKNFRRFLPVFTFQFLYLTARGMTLPLFPQYYVSVNFTPFDIGLAFAAYGGSFLVFEALWGFVFERYGIRGLMPPIAIALTSLAVLLFSRPAGLGEVLVYETLLGAGLGGAGVYPRLVIAHQAEYEDRGRAYGLLGFTYAIGATLGSLLAGVTSSLIGVPKSFFLAAAITLASIIPVWWSNRSRELIEKPAVSNATNDQNTSKPSSKFNKEGLIILGLVGLVAAGGNGFFSLLFPNILIKSTRLGASVFEISLIIAAYNLSAGLMQPVVGALGTKKPRTWIIGCLIATGFIYFVIILAQSVIQVGIITVALGIVYAAITPLTLLLLTTFVPSGYWGRIIGLYGAAEDVGIIIVLSLGSFIWGIWGAQYPFVMMGAIFCIVGAVCLLALRTGKLGQEPKPVARITD